MNKIKIDPIKHLKEDAKILKHLSHFVVSEEMSDEEFRLYCLIAVSHVTNKEGKVLNVDELADNLVILKRKQLTQAFEKFKENVYIATVQKDE